MAIIPHTYIVSLYRTYIQYCYILHTHIHTHISSNQIKLLLYNTYLHQTSRHTHRYTHHTHMQLDTLYIPTSPAEDNHCHIPAVDRKRSKQSLFSACSLHSLPVPKLLTKSSYNSQQHAGTYCGTKKKREGEDMTARDLHPILDHAKTMQTPQHFTTPLTDSISNNTNTCLPPVQTSLYLKTKRISCKQIFCHIDI